MEPTVAFEDWYRREHGRLAASLVVVAGDLDAATDAVDEAFARALDRWDVGVGDGLARRLDLPGRAQRAAPPDAAGQPRAAGGAGRQPGARRRDLPDPELWDAVGRLPRRQREAIVLRYVADLPEADIAAAMGIARGTVAATLAAARRRLEEDLRPELVVEEIPND